MTRTPIRAVKVGDHPDLFPFKKKGRGYAAKDVSVLTTPLHNDWRKMSPEALAELPGEAFTDEDIESISDENPDLYEDLKEQRIERFVAQMVKWKDGHYEDIKNGHVGNHEYFVDQFQNWLANEEKSTFDELVSFIEDSIGESLQGYNEAELSTVLRDPNNWEVEAKRRGEEGKGVWSDSDEHVSDTPDGRKYNEDVDELLSTLNADDLKEAERALTRKNIYVDLKRAHEGAHQFTIEYGDDVIYYATLNKQAFADGMAEVSKGLERVKRDSTEQTVVFKFDDGDYVADLRAEQLPTEGRMQRHCVGRPGMGYGCAVNEKRTRIFSLRDQNAKAKLTFDVDIENDKPTRVVQVAGLGNRKPGFNSQSTDGPVAKVDEVRKAERFIREYLKLDPMRSSDLSPALQKLKDVGEGAEATASVTKLTGDQLAILRLLAKSPSGTLTVREIEKSRYGNTPWFKRWLQVEQPKKDRLVTSDEIENSDVVLVDDEPRDLADQVLKSATSIVLDWGDEHSILPNNKVFGLVVPEQDVPKLFAPFGEAAVKFLLQYSEKAQMSGHPVVPGKVLLAWVRYSELDDGTLWVHEVQTDMFWAVGARHITQQDVQQAMALGGPYSKETNYFIRDVIKQRATDVDEQMMVFELEVLKAFVAKHPARIVFPTMKYRVGHYPADMFGDKAAPASVYSELPKKLRFEKAYTKNLDLPVEVPVGEVWVHASVVASSDTYQRVSRAVRYALANNQKHVVLAMSFSDEVDEVVKAVAADQDMSDLVLGKKNETGLKKLHALAELSESYQAKQLLRLVEAGEVIDFSERLEQKKADDKKKAKEKMDSFLEETYDLITSDPGFQQAKKKREAENKMAEHAAGPQKFQKNDRVKYGGDEEAIPADWVGRVVDHEWHVDHDMDPSTKEVKESRHHYYIIKWRNPKLGQYHEGFHHQDDLAPVNQVKADSSYDIGLDQDQVKALAKKLLKNDKLVELTLTTLFKPANWKHVSDWSEKTWTDFIKENSQRKLPLLKAGKLTAAMMADDLRLAARLIQASAPMVTGEEVLSADEREQMNAALMASGFDGGHGFSSLHAAMEALAEAVSPLGFVVAGALEEQRMGEPKGSLSVRLARRSASDVQAATDVGNSTVQVQWFERGPDNVEVVAVAS